MSVKLALPVALLLTMSLSACNDASTDATTDATTGGVAGDGAALTGDETPPGTELAIGDTAVLPLTYGTEGSATVEMTVTGIKEGTAADLKAAKVKNAADYAPFYVTVDMKILEVGPAGFGGYTPGSDVDGLIGDTKAGSLIVLGDFAPCDSGGFEYDAAAGDTATSCVPALATKGSVVDGAQLHGGSDDYDQFDGEPVVWR